MRSVQVPGLVPAQGILAVMIGASCAFATPIGYQTNLMVCTKGGYRFADFGGLGGVLTLVVGFTACGVLYAMPHDMLPASTPLPLSTPAAPPLVVPPPAAPTP